jgi:hypothetical protein
VHFVAQEKPESELARLVQEQRKARQDEIFDLSAFPLWK